MLRTVLAALIAVTVLLAPVASGGLNATTTHVADASSMQDMPCSAPDDCNGSASCIVKCFNCAMVEIGTIEVMARFDVVGHALIRTHYLRGHSAPPPTHPPPALLIS